MVVIKTAPKPASSIGSHPSIQQTRQMASSTTTNDPVYWLQLRPKITIKSNDGNTTYFTYDSFVVDRGSFSSDTFSTRSFSFGSSNYSSGSGSFTSDSFTPQSHTILSTFHINPSNALGIDEFGPAVSFNSNPNILRIIKVSVNLGMNQAGTFEIMIEDSDRVINRNVVGLGCRFNIAVGKTPTSYQDIMHGYCKRVETKRDDTGLLVYVFSGYGSQIICNERIVDFNKFAIRTAMGSAIPAQTDQQMIAYQLVRTLFEGTGHLPIKGLPTIIQQGGFTESQIDNKVNSFIPAISQPLVQASAVLDTIANYAGAIWGIQNDDIYFRYPTAVHTGVRIKDTVEDTDPINKTSYYIGPWSFIDSIDQGDGYANALWLKGGTLDPTADVESTSNNGYTSLYNKDLAVQVIPGSARLKNLALLLSRVGSGGSSHSVFITGGVFHDSGGHPTGSKILDLQIPVSSIAEHPTAVFDFAAKFSVKDIPVDKPVWIILYAKGTSEDQTIRWHHDGDFTTPNRFSASRTVSLNSTNEDRTNHPLKDETTGWKISSTGPIYSHAFFKGVKALSHAADPQAQQKYGIIEAVHDVSWISDNQSLQNYATSVLASLAKPIRKFEMQQITIPNDFVFLPGMQIIIEDHLSDILAPQAMDAEIQEVRYEFSAPSSSSAQSSSAPSNSPGAGGGSHGLGTNYCSIMPICYLDSLSSGL